jgi:cysteinyl-tRNA synthetase
MVIGSFTEALDEDLNISKAWGIIFEWIRDLNRAGARGGLSPQQAVVALATWKKLDEMLGLDIRPKSPARLVDETEYSRGVGSPANLATSVEGEEEVPSNIIELAQQRMLARKAKDFKRSDEIRDELKAKGWIVEDSPKGPKLKKI